MLRLRTRLRVAIWLCLACSLGAPLQALGGHGEFFPSEETDLLDTVTGGVVDSGLLIDGDRFEGPKDGIYGRNFYYKLDIVNGCSATGDLGFPFYYLHIRMWKMTDWKWPEGYHTIYYASVSLIRVVTRLPDGTLRGFVVDGEISDGFFDAERTTFPEPNADAARAAVTDGMTKLGVDPPCLMVP